MLKYDQDDLTEAMNAVKEDMFNDLLEHFALESQGNESIKDSTD